MKSAEAKAVSGGSGRFWKTTTGYRQAGRHYYHYYYYHYHDQLQVSAVVWGFLEKLSKYWAAVDETPITARSTK